MRDQVTGMTYSDGTPAVTMSYDAAGRPLEIGNAVATDAYAYDDAGQLAVETQSVAGHPAAMRTLTHSHDADGLRTGLVYPGGKVLAAGYTARGQLATMTFHGQPIGTVYGNGAQRTLSYDAAGRLTGTGTNVGAATITGRGYALDAVGRRTGYVDETAANAVFSYDPAGQVLGGTVPVPGQPASVNTYAYDPEGNRTQSSTGIQPAPADPVTITGSTTYTANPLNQYTAITGNPAPTYDADGNLLSGLRSPLSGFTCTWNGENRMLSSTSANVAITDRRVENAYDALGRRVRKTVKFASTGAVIEDRYFIYDGWNVIEETIAPATGPVETAEAVWGTDLSGTAQGAGGVGGLLLRETTANGASYYHYDGNGNVTALTSTTGTLQAAYTYGPFGETLRAVGPLAQANPWRFSTKYQDDETGLLYYGYRFYNPTDGRWPSRDPIEERGGVNTYGFVENRPQSACDTLGLTVTKDAIVNWKGDIPAITNQRWNDHAAGLTSPEPRFEILKRHDMEGRPCIRQLIGELHILVETKAGVILSRATNKLSDSVAEHESEHVKIWEDHWNNWVAYLEGNRFEGRCFCSEREYEKTVTYLLRSYQVMRAQAGVANAQYDVDDYGHRSAGAVQRLADAKAWLKKVIDVMD